MGVSLPAPIALFYAAHKLNQLLYLRCLLHVLEYALEGIADIQFAAEQQAIGSLEYGYLLVSEVLALKSADVEAPRLGRVAVSNNIRRYITHYLGSAPDHSRSSYGYVLMKSGQPPDIHVISNNAMPTNPGVIGQQDMIANYNIVADVGVSHQQVVITDARSFFFATGAMDGDKLADGIILTDEQIAPLAFVFHILGRLTEHCTGVNLGISAYYGAGPNYHIGANFATVAYLGILFNNGIGTDGYVAT